MCKPSTTSNIWSIEDPVVTITYILTDDPPCLTTFHYSDVMMTTMASQITSLTVVYSIVYSDADQRKHQSSASLAFVMGIHRSRSSNAENVSIWWRHHVDSRFAPSQWETTLLCNGVSHCLGASLESALDTILCIYELRNCHQLFVWTLLSMNNR